MERTFAVLFGATYLLLLVGAPAGAGPWEVAAALGLGLLYVLIGILGFTRVARAGTPRALARYFAVQVPLGVVVLLLSHVVGGASAGVLFLLLLVGQAMWTLPLRVGSALAALVALVLLAMSLLIGRADGWVAGAREGVFLVVAVLFTAMVSVVAVRERRTRAHAQRLAAELDTANRQLRVYAQQAEELATARERNRIARELHDTLAQGFTGVTMQLEAVESALERNRLDLVHERLSRARTLARDSLAEARRSMWALRPQALADNTLLDAIRAAVHTLVVDTPLQVQVGTQGTPTRLPPRAEADLLRVAQEAVTNVVKHAHATTLTVELCYGEHDVALRVRDNGRGVRAGATTAPPDGSGFGLLAMRERVEHHGGTFMVHTQPAGGSEIVARIPATTRSTP